MKRFEQTGLEVGRQSERKPVSIVDRDYLLKRVWPWLAHSPSNDTFKLAKFPSDPNYFAARESRVSSSIWLILVSILGKERRRSHIVEDMKDSDCLIWLQSLLEKYSSKSKSLPSLYTLSSAAAIRYVARHRVAVCLLKPSQIFRDQMARLTPSRFLVTRNDANRGISDEDESLTAEQREKNGGRKEKTIGRLRRRENWPYR